MKFGWAVSENPDTVPDTLSTITKLPERKPGEWSPRTRRARSNIRGTRANTLPPVIPGEKIFRISPDSKVGRATLRKWARRNGYEVKGKGKIPAEVRDAFMAQNGIWTVRIISVMPPGATEFMQLFQVRQGSYVRNLKGASFYSDDPFYVKRLLGDELFPLLKQVVT